MSVERKYIVCIRVAETATFTFEARKRSGGARDARGLCTAFPARTPAASAKLDGGNGRNADRVMDLVGNAESPASRPDDLILPGHDIGQANAECNGWKRRMGPAASGQDAR